MENQSPTLESLLQDPFFIRWIKGEATAEENKYWEKWSRQSPHHLMLTRKAGKIVTIPFNSGQIPDSEVSKEWDRLKKGVSKHDSENEAG